MDWHEGCDGVSVTSRAVCSEVIARSGQQWLVDWRSMLCWPCFMHAPDQRHKALPVWWRLPCNSHSHSHSFHIVTVLGPLPRLTPQATRPPPCTPPPPPPGRRQAASPPCLRHRLPAAPCPVAAGLRVPYTPIQYSRSSTSQYDKCPTCRLKYVRCMSRWMLAKVRPSRRFFSLASRTVPSTLQLAGPALLTHPPAPPRSRLSPNPLTHWHFHHNEQCDDYSLSPRQRGRFVGASTISCPRVQATLAFARSPPTPYRPAPARLL